MTSLTTAVIDVDGLQSLIGLLHGEGWAAEIPVRPAAADCAQRLVGQPERLVAHAYVRYLGDLSGGQMLLRVVASGLQLPLGEGVRFYDFGSAETVALLSRDFRRSLDQLADDEDLARALVDEAVDAFARHRRLFEQLAPLEPTAA